jgi:outer membrane protein X
MEKMKRLLIVFLALAPFVMNAQNIGFRLDAGLGGAFTFGSLKSYGIAAFTEPKVLIGSNITAGIRLEGDVLIGGTIADVAEELEIGMSTRAAILLKGEYYITDSKVRPYVGLGLGQYTVANTSATGTGAASITAGNHFGFAPEVGIALGNFRISGVYHILTGEDLLTLSTGATEPISMNYFVVQIAFKVFGINAK